MKLDAVDPKRTAVFVIDMVNDFIEPGLSPLYSEMGYNMVPKLNDFCGKCRDMGMLMVYFTTEGRADGRDRRKPFKACESAAEGKTLAPGAYGSKLYKDIVPKEGDVVLMKRRYDGFFGTELEMILRSCGIETVVITGVCTEACCFSTARTAQAYEYDVAFISDLTGTIDYEDQGFGAMTALEMHNAMLVNINLTTGAVMTADEFLAHAAE